MPVSKIEYGRGGEEVYMASGINEYKDMIGCPAMFTSMHDKK